MTANLAVEQLQSLISALQQPEAYPHAVNDITLVETHISWVFLTGQYAYKLKKPVNFGFLDFSTLEKRQHYCEEELRLNRRFAPHLYLGVVAICGTPEKPLVDKTGDVLEYAVKMQQFDPQQSFDELLAHNELTPSIIEESATTIATFHQHIATAKTETRFGEPSAIKQPVLENFEQLQQALKDAESVDDIRDASKTLRQWSIDHHEKLLDVFQNRKQDGFIRECHGDLHLRNIMIWVGKVTPFDGIEFNDNLRWIDVMNELAFLLMDLADHQQPLLARLLLNCYLFETGDYEGLATLRYYLIYRAMVRAKVASLRLGQLADPHEVSNCVSEIRNYIQLALTYTETPPAHLIITHGLSGSGKSYLAKQLALHTDLIHLRSDVERKRLFNLSETERSNSTLNAGIYQQQATRDTYERLLGLAENCITNGFSVMVDATFLQRWQRDLFRSLAESNNCSFKILHCHADTTIMQQRIQQRAQQGRDASEADNTVLQSQLDHHQPLENDELIHTLTIDTAGEHDVSSIVEQLLR